MDPALLGPHKKEMLRELREVEAASAREPQQRRVLLLLSRLRRSLLNELELHQVRKLEFGLGQSPQCDAPVRRDREEVEVLGEILLLPAHLPHRVGVLTGLHGRLVDGRLRLRAHVVHTHGAVVQPDAQHRRVLRMPVEAHDAAVYRARELGPRRVLEREEAQHAATLLHEVERAVANREKVTELGVPLDGGDVLLLRLLEHEAASEGGREGGRGGGDAGEGKRERGAAW